MAGTHKRGLQTRDTMYAERGRDYYVKLGALGGSVPRRETRHFYLHPEVARVPGNKGGKTSSRAKNKPPIEERRKQAQRWF